jgi:hypothetical protein
MLSRLAIGATLATAVIACSVGEVPLTGDPGGGSNACVTRVAPPATSHIHVAGGGANAGQNCVASGCHLTGAVGANAPAYQYAGTVYAAGTQTPSAGATVQIKMGVTVRTAVTDDAGNFSFPNGALTGTFSATVVVSACPAVMTMPDALVSGGDPVDTNCNGCHGAAGSKPPITL